MNHDALWVVLQKTFWIPEKLLHSVFILKALQCTSRHKMSCTGLWQGVEQVFHQESIMTGRYTGFYCTLFNIFFDAASYMTIAQHPGCRLKVLYNQEAELVES